nr:hypothetical protein [Tanacetum cinerariifolium]
MFPKKNPIWIKPLLLFGFTPQWIGGHIPNINNGWLEEDSEEEPQEEEIEDEDMVNDDEDDVEVINPYEEADPHNRRPRKSDEETEFAPPVVPIADADDVPIPPVIQFGSNIHIRESSAIRDLFVCNSGVYAPAHYGEEAQTRQTSHEWPRVDITALDSTVRENRSQNSKMMKMITSLSREFTELKNQNSRAEKLSRWEAWVRERIPNNLRFQEEPSIYIAHVPRVDDITPRVLGSLTSSINSQYKLRWLAKTLKKGSPFRLDSETNEPPLRTYQHWKKTFYEETYKLDDMTEFPKLRLKKSYEEDLESEIVMVKIPSCMSFLGCTNAYDEPIGNLDKMGDEVENPSPQSTPQVLPLFEEYTPPVTYLKEVKETLGTPIEVKPLDQTKLEDVALSNRYIPLISREIPSVDELEPQLLLNFSPLDVNLGEKSRTDPPIDPYSLDSFRMKVIDALTIHTLPSHHIASFHREHVYCYNHRGLGNPKKHYEFKPGNGYDKKGTKSKQNQTKPSIKQEA